MESNSLIIIIWYYYILLRFLHLWIELIYILSYYIEVCDKLPSNIRSKIIKQNIFKYSNGKIFNNIIDILKIHNPDINKIYALLNAYGYDWILKSNAMYNNLLPYNRCWWSNQNDIHWQLYFYDCELYWNVLYKRRYS